MRQDEQIDDEFYSYLTLVAVFILGEHAAMTDDVMHDVMETWQSARRRISNPQKMRVYLIQTIVNRSRAVNRHIRVRGC
jgi:DNA-directed RNA polymerase specialized sigma24 family protein